MKEPDDMSDEELLAEWDGPAPDHFTDEWVRRVQGLADQILRRGLRTLDQQLERVKRYWT